MSEKSKDSSLSLVSKLSRDAKTILDPDFVFFDPDVVCGMKGCNAPAAEELEILEHPDLREELGLPPKITKLKVCLQHALVWKIGWLFADYGIGVSHRFLNELVFRAIAEAGER